MRGNSYIVKSNDNSNFENVYYVNLDHIDLKKTDIEAEVISYKAGEFAIVKANDSQVAKLSHKLHHIASGCGHLIKLLVMS